MDTKAKEHITCRKGICGGRPHIAGHRIRVQDVVLWHEKLGFSPDEIVSKYPQLTLGNVHAALAYYHDHMLEIRRDMEEDEKISATVEETTPSKLLKKLVRDAGQNSLSPG